MPPVGANDEREQSAAGLLDGPGQVALDRGGGFVDVVAIKAHPGLKPQGIARAKADGRDTRSGHKRLGKGHGPCVRH